MPGYAALLARPIEAAIHLTAAIINSNQVPLGRPAALVRDLLTSLVLSTMRDAPPTGAEWVGSD